MMSSEEKPAYHVDRLASVSRTIQILGQLATDDVTRDELATTLLLHVTHLQKEPLTWGDPQYHPKKPGSVVCHALRDLLHVQYVVFEPEREVVILRIKHVTLLPF